ncbi:MAG: hypothetical protein ACYDDP_04805 [Acidithiobacillus sp.]
MADVTFTSPPPKKIGKDLTVYAPAGDCHALLAIEDAELKDLPPPWRLACQYIVRDEDILVRL